jgi:hypothetical protein
MAKVERLYDRQPLGEPGHALTPVPLDRLPFIDFFA